jgi:hypothetical protein
MIASDRPAHDLQRATVRGCSLPMARWRHAGHGLQPTGAVSGTVPGLRSMRRPGSRGLAHRWRAAGGLYSAGGFGSRATRPISLSR